MSNALLVVGDQAALTSNDTWLHDRLVTLGYTVTYINDETAAPGNLNTGYQIVVLSKSVTAATLGTKYDAATIGVMSVALAPITNFSSGSLGGGATQQTLYVLVTSADPVTGPSTGTTTIQSGNTVAYQFITDTTLGPGAVKMLAATSGLPTRITGSRYDTGTTMANSAIAPSRRLRISLSDVTTLNATGTQWFDQAVAWTAAGNILPVANAGPDQSVAPGASVGLSGSGTDADGTIASYAWTQVSGTAVTLSSTTTASPTFTAPASVNGAILVFGLTVTDNSGGVSPQDQITVNVAPAPYLLRRESGAWVRRALRRRVAGAWVWP